MLGALTAPRAAITVAILALAVLTVLPADPARADGAHGGDASDYRVEIVSIEGDLRGASIAIAELGDRLELRRGGAGEVVVLGYENEPYLRLDAAGVWQNERSPAVALNSDRFARHQPPVTADSAATPRWQQISNGEAARWHDHRAHWMAPQPPVEAQRDPSREHPAPVDGRVPLVVDGAAVTVVVAVTWVPSPSMTLWLIASAALALVAVSLLARLRRSTFAFAGAILVGVVSLLPGAALGPAWASPWVIGAIGAAALALAATSWPEAAPVAGGVIIGAVLVRRTAFEHAVLAGAAAPSVQRAGLALSFAAGAAVVVIGVRRAFQQTSTRGELGAIATGNR